MADSVTQHSALLCELGEIHSDLVVVDVGVSTAMNTDSFHKAFPERYFNLGIAEQNAVGFASGLARQGYIPLVHGFGNFLARRAHDQIAVSVAWPSCNVKFISGSCGLFDSRNGPSHTATDDLGSMAALPGMIVLEPGDNQQSAALLRKYVKYVGPVYFRTRRYGMPSDLVPGAATTTVMINKADKAALTLVAGGSMLAEVIHAARILHDMGYDADLIHLPALSPLNPESIVISAQRTGLVVVVENHVAAGGFGDAVSRHLGPLGVRMLRFALPDAFIPAGDAKWQLHQCGLDAVNLANHIAATFH